MIDDNVELPSSDSHFLQWRQYESIDFEHLLTHPTTSVANSYPTSSAMR